MEKRLFLIDGHALIFKMYYAFLGRPMVNSRGVDTSILFGFTKYLLELLEKEKPTHIAVFFDPPGGTFRNELYPEYKANRGETPQLVIDALEPLTGIVRALNIPVLTIPGYEADDVIGAMAKRAAREGFEVYMVTPDKDYGQLVEPSIFQYRQGKNGENEVLGPTEVCEKWGISRPEQVIDILAICGDAADNVPGVQGVGPVGAAKLLGKYDTLEGIYDHLDELTPRQRELFLAAKDHIALSKELVTIKTDILLETTSEDMKLDIQFTPELESLFNLYEFPSLKKKIGHSGVEKPALTEFHKKIRAFRYDASADRMTVAFKDEVTTGTAEDFRSVLEDENIVKAGFGLKRQIRDLWERGIDIKGEILDVELMHYLLNPELEHSLPHIAATCLGIDLPIEENTKQGSLFEEESLPDRSREVVATFHLADLLRRELEDSGTLSLYEDIEEPLVWVLARMEKVGVKMDAASLKDFADSLRVQMLEAEKKVRDIAGEPALNVASPKQIGDVIFEKLALDPSAKKPKSGNWPTDEQTLSELSDRSPIIDAILDYRGLRKLLSTYIEPIPSYISPADGRVHTTFNQALTSTGRLSSSNPNLQNIPVRTEQGREIRKAFVPSNPDWVIMSADYSQIELRIMAHLCGDEHMIKAFRDGVDVHSATASKIFGKPLADITPDDRRVAKTANFGIMYGISAFGLAQRLGCSRIEAKRIIEDYFISFPSIRSFIDKTLRVAREKGYVETIFGRRRYTPDIAARNPQMRAFAERNAVNAPIQGSAADIIKLAMIEVDRRLRKEEMKSLLVLQIHDELLLEVPPEEIDKVKDILVSSMENVVKLSVPLTVECNYGKTWLEAH